MRTQKKSSRNSSNGRQNSAAVVQPSPAVHVRRQDARTIHFLTQDELRRLFKVIRSKRDKAIFPVAYRHGLRASEIGLLQRSAAILILEINWYRAVVGVQDPGS